MNLLLPYRIYMVGLSVALSLLSLPGMLFAQVEDASLSITVTPPLFQLSIAPGETWASALKVVNNNEYDVTYYAQVVDFEAQGEEGKGEMIPLIEEFVDPKKQTYSLASWVELPTEPIFVKKGESGEVPFTVRIPLNAEPGGHYAAILVGTQPPVQSSDGPSLRVSSFVSSLLFTKVSGEVVESGRIREFHTEQTIYDRPEADFLLRFENTGNTHLRPQGGITIYNMWGKERGEIGINQKSSFGNVLPQSTRHFSFSWSADSGVLDIGRYSAVVTLAYGDEDKQNTSATAYFWVVPTIPVAFTLAAITLFVLLMSWFIRRYVRRALALEKERVGSFSVPVAAQSPLEVLMEPLREGVVDLRRIAKPGRVAPVPHTMGAATEDTPNARNFARKYRLFFVFLAVVVGALFMARMVLDSALESNREFNISDVVVAEDPGAL